MTRKYLLFVAIATGFGMVSCSSEEEGTNPDEVKEEVQDAVDEVEEELSLIHI